MSDQCNNDNYYHEILLGLGWALVDTIKYVFYFFTTLDHIKLKTLDFVVIFDPIKAIFSLVIGVVMINIIRESFRG